MLMKGAHENVVAAVGHTPIVRLNRLASHVAANIYVKLEYLNPGGSAKDRPAIQIVLDAEADGTLTRRDHRRVDERQHGYGPRDGGLDPWL